ncbi:hypothetical protein D3C72_1376480 [compost metagenome]
MALRAREDGQAALGPVLAQADIIMAAHAVQIGMPVITFGFRLRGRLLHLDRRDRRNGGLFKAHATGRQQGRAQGEK